MGQPEDGNNDFQSLDLKLLHSPLIQPRSEINPENDSTWCSMAELFIEQGNLVEAQKCYEKALSINSENPDAVEGISKIKSEKNN